MTPQSPERRIILHAGFHKTGTTSLQDSLRVNAARLAPLWRVNTRADDHALCAVLDSARDYSVSGDDEDLAMVSAGTVLWLSHLDLKPGEGLLASSEDFAGHMPGKMGVKHYGAAAKVLRHVVETMRLFYQGRVQVDVVFTTRAPDPWLRSLYFQQAKHLDMKLDFADFCRAIPKAADHEAAVLKVGRKLGRTPVHLFALEDYADRKLGPAEAMFALARLPSDLLASLVPISPRNSNPSGGIALAEALARLNRQGLPSHVLRRAKEDLINAAVLQGAGTAVKPPDVQR